MFKDGEVSMSVQRCQSRIVIELNPKSLVEEIEARYSITLELSFYQTTEQGLAEFLHLRMYPAERLSALHLCICKVRT